MKMVSWFFVNQNVVCEGDVKKFMTFVDTAMLPYSDLPMHITDGEIVPVFVHSATPIYDRGVYVIDSLTFKSGNNGKSFAFAHIGEEIVTSEVDETKPIIQFDNGRLMNAEAANDQYFIDGHLVVYPTIGKNRFKRITINRNAEVQNNQPKKQETTKAEDKEKKYYSNKMSNMNGLLDINSEFYLSVNDIQTIPETFPGRILIAFKTGVVKGTFIAPFRKDQFVFLTSLKALVVIANSLDIDFNALVEEINQHNEASVKQMIETLNDPKVLPCRSIKDPNVELRSRIKAVLLSSL